MKNTITWEHWSPPEDPIKKMMGSMRDDIYRMEDIDDEEFDEDDEGGMKIMGGIPMSPHYATPIGVYTHGDPSCPSKMFNCWIMHANFDLTAELAIKIGKVPGVEVATIMTRYRAFVGISPVFDLTEVRLALEEALCGTPHEEPFITEMKSQLSEHKRWAIHVNKEGQVQHICSNTDFDEDYEKQLTLLKKLDNGRVITSEDRS